MYARGQEFAPVLFGFAPLADLQGRRTKGPLPKLERAFDVVDWKLAGHSGADASPRLPGVSTVRRATKPRVEPWTMMENRTTA